MKATRYRASRKVCKTFIRGFDPRPRLQDQSGQVPEALGTCPTSSTTNQPAPSQANGVRSGTEFPADAGQQAGQKPVQSLRSCPDRMRAYNRQWMAQRRAAYFAGKCCARCGSPDRLELDHVDPSTKEHHAIWSWSPARREVELAKCQVLCHSCHKRKTAIENSRRQTGLPNLPCRRFSAVEVQTILEALAGGAGVRALAQRYGVSHSVISDIKRGTSYREVTHDLLRPRQTATA